jgi:hypothetical protein
VAEAVAIHSRHEHIGYHRINEFAFQALERLDAIRSFHHGMSLGFEIYSQQLSVHVVIVDDEDVHSI